MYITPRRTPPPIGSARPQGRGVAPSPLVVPKPGRHPGQARSPTPELSSTIRPSSLFPIFSHVLGERVASVASRVRGIDLPGPTRAPSRRDLLPHLAHEPLGVLQHQSIRNPQQAYADRSEVIFFCGVSPHLTWLRVNATIKLDGQAMFE